MKQSHWYTAAGMPMHQMTTADGDRTRPTTIRDAKKLKLFPSVTNILGMLAKPALERWKMEQILKQAESSPRTAEEDFAYWMKRTLDGAFKQVEDAADLGSKIHNALEKAFTPGAAIPQESEIDEAIYPYVKPVLEWRAGAKINITATELRVVNLEHGFAGTADVLFGFGSGGQGILDYKSKKTKPGETVIAYPEHRMQLAAYAVSHYGESCLPNLLAANIFISSTEPGRMDVIKHTPQQIMEAWEMFKATCVIWRGLKQYDPRQPAA